MPPALWSGRGGETSPLCFRRQVVMDHCWESGALSADFQIRSHQDMPPHSCCDKGAALHADQAVLWRSRSPAACSELPTNDRYDMMCARFKGKCSYFDLAGLSINTLNSSVIILVFQQILKGMSWILCFSAGTTGKKEAANHFRWSSLSNLASILNVGFCWWIELQKCHRMNRWTSEEHSIVNSQVLIMLVKEPPRLVSRCGPLNNQPTSRNMPWFATSSTTGFEAGVLSTTSSVWIIAAKIFFWFVFFLFFWAGG